MAAPSVGSPRAVHTPDTRLDRLAIGIGRTLGHVSNVVESIAKNPAAASAAGAVISGALDIAYGKSPGTVRAALAGAVVSFLNDATKSR